MRPILVVVSLLVFLLIVFLAVQRSPQKSPQGLSAAPEFPADIPLEEGARIVEHYTTVTPDGVPQSSIVFESGRSVEENFTLYRSFFAKGGAWQFIAEVPPGAQGASHGALFARNEGGVVDVNISNAPLTRASSMVELSFRKGSR